MTKSAATTTSVQKTFAKMVFASITHTVGVEKMTTDSASTGTYSTTISTTSDTSGYVNGSPVSNGVYAGDITYNTTSDQFLIADSTGGTGWSEITVAGAPQSASVVVGGWTLTFNDQGDLVVRKDQEDGSPKQLLIDGQKVFDLLEKLAYAVIE